MQEGETFVRRLRPLTLTSAPGTRPRRQLAPADRSMASRCVMTRAGENARRAADLRGHLCTAAASLRSAEPAALRAEGSCPTLAHAEMSDHIVRRLIAASRLSSSLPRWARCCCVQVSSWRGSTVMTMFVRSPAGSMSMVVRCSYGSWPGTKSISDS